VDHKDHANLLEAAALVRTQIPDIQVCIAGDGPLRASLEAKREALGLASCVHFLGYRTDAPAITRAADVYVSSSWSEGLGTSILEALAAGVPVVAAEAGGAREMVIPDETGFLTPVRDPQALAKAIIASLRDRDQARRMAEAGQRRALEMFSVTRMVARTLATYKELLGRS
jgi:glycosyltransferase involved in cell wall biosynthesis